MTTSPDPIQPSVTPARTAAQDALTDFEREFIASGARAEFKREARLLWPHIDIMYYKPVTAVCECEDLELHFVRDEKRGSAYFYSVCRTHRLQPLGKAKRMRFSMSREDRQHKARKNGYTTHTWYSQRGM